MRIYSKGESGVWHAAQVLGTNEKATADHIAAFCAAGYLESATSHPDDPGWITTVKGNALAQASLTKPIRRETAERLLRGVIDRTRAYNADSGKILAVIRIDVFGSYLDSAQHQLGDLDLGIQIVRRFEGELWVKRSREYTARSGRNFARFIDELFWPQRELIMQLKKRSSAISFTDEDVSALTDRYQCVYDIHSDHDAVQPPDGATVQRF
jgi:hypothetical protein